MKKNILLTLLIMSIILTISACTSKKVDQNDLQISEETKVLVTNYLKSNIFELSPEKAVLGGSFYVTKIDFEYPDLVLIEYEDGHIALKAKANFKIENENPKIINFQLINEDDPLITNEYLKCTNHDDCVPLPGCHPRECINKKYQNNYDQPEACTMMYDNCVAYEDNNCICQQGICFNENLMNSECSQ